MSSDEGHQKEIKEEDIRFLDKLFIDLSEFDCPGPVLDIGGGGEGVIGQIKGSDVVAIDLIADELREAPPGPLKIVMDATDLGFIDCTFSSATSFFSLMYIEESLLGKVFEEVYRALKPGGIFYAWGSIIPPRPNETAKTIAAIRLTINLPKGEITTGYGVPWPKNGRTIESYLDPARSAGFELEEKETKNNTFYLRLTKT